MKEIQIPSWVDCDEKSANFDRTDRTVYSAAMHGTELNPLEIMVYEYDDSDPDRSRKYIKSLKALVEWCLNSPNQVLANHESLASPKDNSK